MEKAKSKPHLGLYFHIPFCRSKCLYCDFCSRVGQTKEKMKAYTDALCRELLSYQDRLGGYSVDTVYFGGGTPSLLPEAMLCEILDAVSAHCSLDADAEVTLECNPATVNREALRTLRQAGFNRLSIGVQSVHEDELRTIGRRHTYSDVITVFEDARRAGFSNLSADVMMGLPGQSTERYLKTLETLTELDPEHLSSYCLTLEEGTPLCRLVSEGKLILPDEEETERMYFEGLAYLESRGLSQYEISNFAKIGYQSRHNLKYWSCEEYLGLGVAAYSDFLGERFGNSRKIDAYIEGRDVKEASEFPDERERQNEYIMLRLRLREGIRRDAFCRRFGEGTYTVLEQKMQSYIRLGYAQRTGDGLCLTPKGFYVSNAILSELLEFDG